MEVFFILSLLLSSTTGRPLSPEETQALQGLAPTFDPPPKGWNTPNADRIQDQDFDYNGVGGVGLYAAAVRVIFFMCRIISLLMNVIISLSDQHLSYRVHKSKSS